MNACACERVRRNIENHFVSDALNLKRVCVCITAIRIALCLTSDDLSMSDVMYVRLCMYVYAHEFLLSKTVACIQLIFDIHTLQVCSEKLS